MFVALFYTGMRVEFKYPKSDTQAQVSQCERTLQKNHMLMNVVLPIDKHNTCRL